MMSLLTPSVLPVLLLSQHKNAFALAPLLLTPHSMLPPPSLNVLNLLFQIATNLATNQRLLTMHLLVKPSLFTQHASMNAMSLLMKHSPFRPLVLPGPRTVSRHPVELSRRTSRLTTVSLLWYGFHILTVSRLLFSDWTSWLSYMWCCACRCP